MDGPQNDPSTNEDRFARKDFRKYSVWASVIVIIGLAIITGLVFYFFRSAL
jgi:hypothetical protein